MPKQKVMDVSGIPFVVEEREDGLYAVGIKVRKRMIRLEGSGLPMDVVEKISGEGGNDRIDGVEEIEDFLDGIPEGSKLKDMVPEEYEYASDEEMENAWEDVMAAARESLHSE